MYGAEVFPDVELVLTGFLRDVLPTLAAGGATYAADVAVANRLPNPRPPRAVTVRQDGGRRRDEVSLVARVGVNVWAMTEQDATDLARLVAAALEAWTPPPVEHVQSMAAFSAIADESGQPRRYGSFEVTVTGTPLTLPA